MTGLEPATPSSQKTYATKLRSTPIHISVYSDLAPHRVNYPIRPLTIPSSLEDKVNPAIQEFILLFSLRWKWPMPIKNNIHMHANQCTFPSPPAMVARKTVGREEEHNSHAKKNSCWTNSMVRFICQHRIHKGSYNMSLLFQYTPLMG